MAKPFEEQESDIIQQVLDGDLEAFNQLVLQYQDRVYSVAYRVMGNAYEADDMTQEAFITAFKKLSSYRGGSFGAWLSRITTNLCYDELRREKRRPATSFEELPGSDTDDGAPIPSHTATPEQTTQQIELQNAIQDCINGLKHDQKIVLVMSDVQGFSYQEIADQFALQLGTVKSRLSRARKAVQQCLQASAELLPAEYRL